MACAACTAWRDSFVRSFVAAAVVRPRATKFGRDDECIAPSVPKGKIHSLTSFHQLPATLLQQIMLGLFLSDLPSHARIATVAELYQVYYMLRSFRAQRQPACLLHIRQHPLRHPSAGRKRRGVLGAGHVRYPRAAPLRPPRKRLQGEEPAPLCLETWNASSSRQPPSTWPTLSAATASGMRWRIIYLSSRRD